ncbi:MAG TPA: aminopeptidase, partial [Kosmotogaceae bacterium]
MPKDKNKELQQQLSYRTHNAWQNIPRGEMESYVTEYSEFLDRARTERRCVAYAVDYLRSHGFVSLDEAEEKGKNAERKIYHAKAGKAVIAMRIPEGEVSAINLIGAHIDVPRLDLKPVPLVEDSGLAMLKTHYYGGIRKYQWLNIPLALVGTVIDREGKAIEISTGEDPTDPVFVICDLLPHLDDRSGDFKEIFKGKDLNALSGSEPLSFDENFKEAVKLNCLKLL